MYSAKKDCRAAIWREIQEEREARQMARELLEEEHFGPEGHVPGTRADLCCFCAVERMRNEDGEARITLRDEG